jgi:soluble lytic murein transglycosylase-like protein
MSFVRQHRRNSARANRATDRINLRDLGHCAARAIGYYCIVAAVVFFVLAIGGCLNWVSAAELRIPEASARYRIAVERASGSYFGLDASPARLAAQLHQESGWRANAQSKFAGGLAQFTPATARWLPEACPELGSFDPWDPMQSIRAAACYDALLYRQQKPMGGGKLPPCARWVFALRAYNGGAGWINRERRAALAAGDNPDDWQAVENHRLRAAWAHTENIGYPRRILLRIEPAYIAAGWAGTAVCP